MRTSSTREIDLMKMIEVPLSADGRTSTHTGVAVTACLLSLAVHMLVMVCLSMFPLNIPAALQDLQLTRRWEAIRLDDVTPAPGQQKTIIARSGQEQGMSETDLAKHANDLALQPDKAAMEPPAILQDDPVEETRNIAQPTALPERKPWKARREILMIEDRIVADEVSTLKRRNIPTVERITETPDISPPIEREIALDSPPAEWQKPGEGIAPEVDATWKTEGGAVTEPSALQAQAPRTGLGSELFPEDPAAITQFTAIEDLLKIEVTVYSSDRDSKYGYFRIEITRAGEDILPVMPKDIILVQDCSASIAENRLHFCRDALMRCLARIGPQDRFNVASFKDSSVKCFDTWSKNTPQALEQAGQFIEKMRSGGNTDIFSSVKDLVDCDRVPARPIIALLVTDGLPTKGLIDSSDIISEFSKMNNGALSVFAIGTAQTANEYLLDLLSYCNRGDALVIKSGRWDIPESMERVMEGISRPVLADLRFRFAEGSSCEVYPVQTSNLYLDRPLVLHGRHPKKTRNIVFQVVGSSGDLNYDMIFNVDLDKSARAGGKIIREEWAKQKIYSLISQYARNPKPGIMREIVGTAKDYRVKVPHKGKF
jgi:hypothetical protein